MSLFHIFSLIIAFLPPLVTGLAASAKWMINTTQDEVPLVRLTKDIFAPERYDIRVRPKMNHSESMQIHISMSLYQIIEVDEPSQTIKLNVWMIQKWTDEMLMWDPRDYGLINKTILPYSSLWIPDTYLYNSVRMARDETERYMNIQADTLHWEGRNGSNMSFLYPAIYTLTCRLNIRYFPYDQQNCTLTISSWTNSKSALDYYADSEVNLKSFIPNEEWDVVSFKIHRHEYKYACCAEPWVILQASLVIRRKPLYYIVNLIIPTSIITIVSITGFFTPASTDDDRKEKINLGITTLLAMSILMLMVSDAMPTTSEFVPLIAWFYLSIIIIVSIGTFLTSIVLSIQGRRQFGKNPPIFVRYCFFTFLRALFWLDVPPTLKKLWEDLDDHPRDTWRRRNGRKMIDKKIGTNGSFLVLKEGKEGKENKHQPVQSRISENSLRVPGTAQSSIQQPIDKRHSIQMIGFRRLSGSPSGAFGSLRSAGVLPQSGSGTVEQRVSASASTPFPISDVSGTTTPAATTARSRRGSNLWENAITTVLASRSTSRRSSVFPQNKEVDSMRRQRQCSLEWEFLATVLDRILLSLFTLAVFLVTAGVFVVGHMAQLSYDQHRD
ncbi:unnamed protein product, partial [Mesorhabditis belari]|uniref:Uncharacterized protein n=1 Tax=Mesorhabditis belari TaxID=2138241 RepID=A0AAF3F7P0_9BILA